MNQRMVETFVKRMDERSTEELLGIYEGIYKKQWFQDEAIEAARIILIIRGIEIPPREGFSAKGTPFSSKICRIIGHKWENWRSVLTCNRCGILIWVERPYPGYDCKLISESEHDSNDLKHRLFDRIENFITIIGFFSNSFIKFNQNFVARPLRHQSPDLILRKNPTLSFNDWKLLVAASKGQTENVKSLLAKGTNANVTDFRDQSALIRAIRNNHTETVKVLLENGADANVRAINSIGTFGLVARYGSTEILLALLNTGADVDLIDRFGYSALHHANYADIVQILLAQGIDVNIRGKYDGRTPLHWSVLRNQLAVAKVLLENGADAKAKDALGNEPFGGTKSREIQELIRNANTPTVEERLIMKDNVSHASPSTLNAKPTSRDTCESCGLERTCEQYYFYYGSSETISSQPYSKLTSRGSIEHGTVYTTQYRIGGQDDALICDDCLRYERFSAVYKYANRISLCLLGAAISAILLAINCLLLSSYNIATFLKFTIAAFLFLVLWAFIRYGEQGSTSKAELGNYLARELKRAKYKHLGYNLLLSPNEYRNLVKSQS